MKILINLFYLISVFLIAISLFGSTISEPIVEMFSSEVVQSVGIDKAKIDSLDAQIDISFYNMNLLMYRLERLKNFLTFGDDEQKPMEFKKHNYISVIVYEPIIAAVSYIIRGIMLILGILILLMTVIIHTITSYFSLRKRVNILEERVLTLGKGIYAE